MPLDEAVDLETIARATPGFSGADLSNLMNVAALNASREDKKQGGHVGPRVRVRQELDKSAVIRMGPERKSAVISRARTSS